jgi:hypothetical protein
VRFSHSTVSNGSQTQLPKPSEHVNGRRSRFYFDNEKPPAPPIGSLTLLLLGERRRGRRSGNRATAHRRRPDLLFVHSRHVARVAMRERYRERARQHEAPLRP